ncbi:hypothetical protein EJB05_47197, partial [Eragrostis curvula]
GYIRRTKRLSKMMDVFLEHVLDEHNERRREEGEGFVPKDMIDLLLQIADDPDMEVPIQRDGIKATSRFCRSGPAAGCAPAYMGLALKMAPLSLANLLHAFAWRLPNGVVAEELDMEERLRFTMPRNVPLQAVAEPKLPARLYTTYPKAAVTPNMC